MRKFSLEQYIKMSESFNKMTFIKKINTIKENSDILQLGCDGNWWGVRLKDKEIQEKLFDLEINFELINEWDSSEMIDLISLLGIDLTDI